MQSHAKTMNHHVRILHDNEEYFVCLHNSEGPTGEDMIQFQAWAPTLQEAMQRLSQKLEACDQPWKPEIHVGSYAAIILSRDDAARFYLKSLSVPVFYEPADSAPPAELVDLGNLSSEDYITTLCHLSDAHIHRLLAKAAVSRGRGAWATLHRRCRSMAVQAARQKSIACAA
ncbi:hypothetical protein [Verrucomicrobium spinosum]|uniref:hypothetical protein n=1 Tax=Verrucomicrobium spinosum TaxID=2736 RepID=UPI0001745C00|nr:hypothetical protein [Verrucomicrobium spinosum]